MTQPIDYLLAALSEMDEETDGDDDNICANRPSTPPSLQSPRLAKFLTSSSLKRRQFKPSHCKYCSRFRNNRQQVEEHLRDSELCLSLYLREFKVNKLEAILMKLYRCISCGAGGTFQLKRHLGNLRQIKIYIRWMQNISYCFSIKFKIYWDIVWDRS